MLSLKKKELQELKMIGHFLEEPNILNVLKSIWHYFLSQLTPDFKLIYLSSIIYIPDFHCTVTTIHPENYLRILRKESESTSSVVALPLQNFTNG